MAESLTALDTAVRQGKALYMGISSYSAEQTREAIEICRQRGLTMPVIHQPVYNMLARDVERGLLDVTGDAGIGVIAFCPLSQGLLTNKYVDGIPAGSRAATHSWLAPAVEKNRPVLRKLAAIAAQRGQTLSQLALAFLLRDSRVTSTLIGASRVEQIEENVRALEAGPLTDDVLKAIEEALT